MRVAVCAESFDPETGGQARQAVALSHALEGRGHRVRRVGPPAGGRVRRALGLWRRARAARREGYRVCSLGKAPGDVVVPHSGAHLAAICASVRARRAAARPIAAVLKLLTPRQWVLLPLDRLALRAARRVIALSHRSRAELVRLSGCPSARLDVIPNGVDTDRFRAPTVAERQAARRRLGLGPREVALLFVSHNWRLRGLGSLLEALGRLPEARRRRLFILGRGPRALFEARARALSVPATFAGAVEDVRPWLRAADALCHPTWFDPCSLATLEAAAMGVPVVTTRQNGAAELLTSREAVVLRTPDDVAALARAIRRLPPTRGAPPDRVEARFGARRALERLCRAVEQEETP